MGRRKAFGWRHAWLLVLAVASATALAQSRPGAGRYSGEMCVRTGPAAPNCGPAAVSLQTSGRVRVRISDLEYRLTLHSSQLDLVLLHGAMQIDGFSANYEWQGRTLHFADPDKSVRYALRIEP